MIGKVKLRLGCSCEPECHEDDLDLICEADGIHHEYRCPTCGGTIIFVVEPVKPVERRWT